MIFVVNVWFFDVKYNQADNTHKYSYSLPHVFHDSKSAVYGRIMLISIIVCYILQG